MALTIHCTMCGANVVPNDLEIRREIAVCSHCSTLLQITQSGTEQFRDALQTVRAPAGVGVRREKPGNLVITAPRTASALAINRPELVRGTLIGLAVSGGLTTAAALLSVPLILIFGKDLIPFIALSLLLAFIPGSFLAVPASILVLSFTHKTLPPLRLENGSIVPSMVGMKPFPAASIRQMYSTATKVMAGRTEQHFFSYMVYALTTGDHHMPLIGPLDSPETALFIEETLEVDLGILDLPVYGDESLPVQEAKALPVSPKEFTAFELALRRMRRGLDRRRGGQTPGICRLSVLRMFDAALRTGQFQAHPRDTVLGSVGFTISGGKRRRRNHRRNPFFGCAADKNIRRADGAFPADRIAANNSPRPDRKSPDQDNGPGGEE